MKVIKLILVLGWVLSSLIFAQAKEKTEVGFSGFSWKSGELVEINSEKMSLVLNERRVNFAGSVVVKKGKSVIYCDELVLNYSQDGGIEWLRASRGVKLVEGEVFAVGKELEYVKGQNQFVLRGEPKLVSKGQIMSGEEMIFDLSHNRLEVVLPRIQFQGEK